MHPLASALLQTGLALKLNQVKRATSSYARDRVEQSQGAAISYAVAGGLYAAAGIFAIALLLVGVTALFRWVELRYGLFEAFGASAAVLLVLAIICAALAASRLKKPARQFPSLGSRLRVAISATPGKYPDPPARNVSGRDTATAVLSEPATPVKATRGFRGRAASPPAQNSGQIKAGLVLAATLAGWALARRRSVSQAARPIRPAPRPASEANA
ncbi:MAG: phage holin family protein [Tardiphaga sp.]